MAKAPSISLYKSILSLKMRKVKMKNKQNEEKRWDVLALIDKIGG
jgi:hypothetical protein